MLDKKPFGLNTLTKKDNKYLFNVGFEALSYIYFMFP
jgi:hypothetical protein